VDQNLMVQQLRDALVEQEKKVASLKAAIAALSGDDIAAAIAGVGARTDYQDLGVTAAAKKFLREMKEPQDTRAIADALLARGLRTYSKNFIATVYATLNNGKSFKRTTDNRWELQEDKGGEA
jgi:hypothetical protein